MTNNDVNTLNLHPIGPVAFDAIMASMMEINRRLVRVESKQARLMLHFGVSPQFTKPKEDMLE